VCYGKNINVPERDYLERVGIEERATRESFWRLYEKARLHRPTIRVLCSVCFGVGGILLLVVFLMNLWWVIFHLRIW
jgi:hypothetical protein